MRHRKAAPFRSIPVSIQWRHGKEEHGRCGHTPSPPPKGKNPLRGAKGVSPVAAVLLCSSAAPPATFCDAGAGVLEGEGGRVKGRGAREAGSAPRHGTVAGRPPTASAQPPRSSLAPVGDTETERDRDWVRERMRLGFSLPTGAGVFDPAKVALDRRI
jgi:hypothetical protein